MCIVYPNCSLIPSLSDESLGTRLVSSYTHFDGPYPPLQTCEVNLSIKAKCRTLQHLLSHMTSIYINIFL